MKLIKYITIIFSISLIVSCDLGPAEDCYCIYDLYIDGDLVNQNPGASEIVRGDSQDECEDNIGQNSFPEKTDTGTVLLKKYTYCDLS